MWNKVVIMACEINEREIKQCRKMNVMIMLKMAQQVGSQVYGTFVFKNRKSDCNASEMESSISMLILKEL